MEEHDKRLPGDIVKDAALAAMMKAHSARGDAIVHLQDQVKAQKAEIERLHVCLEAHRVSSHTRSER